MAICQLSFPPLAGQEEDAAGDGLPPAAAGGVDRVGPFAGSKRAARRPFEGDVTSLIQDHLGNLLEVDDELVEDFEVLVEARAFAGLREQGAFGRRPSFNSVPRRPLRLPACRDDVHERR